MMIDLVYTWVDGTDVSWLEKRRFFAKNWKDQSKISLFPEPSAAGTAASSEVELFYSMLSVKKFMPWIRNIFIVTDQQIPQRTIEYFKDVIIIDHKDIFPSQASLPTFNSCAIELAIANIKNISDYFIYMNDDLFINQPVYPNSFYQNEKIALFVEKFFAGLKFTPKFIMQSKLHCGTSTQQRCYTNDILNKKYGVYKRHLLQHSPVFIIKKFYQQCLEQFSHEVNITFSHRFRHAEDIVPLNFLYPYFMLHTGHAFFDNTIRSRYIPITDSIMLNNFFYKLIKSKDQFFCLNDSRKNSPQKTIDQMEAFLKKINPLLWR